MQMSGEQRIAVPRQKVWDALNDPDVLAQCIPGCQTLERDGEDRFLAVAEVKIGPIGARFKGNVQLSDMDGPNGYTITGTGNGGIAGSAKGGAKVRLSDAGDGGTVVHYDVDAEVAGRMAQLGGPIIDATAKNLAAKFFTKFADVVGQEGQAIAAGQAAVGAQETVYEREASTSAPVSAQHVPSAYGVHSAVSEREAIWGWVVALLLALVVGFALGQLGSPVVILAVLALVLVTAAASYQAGRRGRAL